MSENLVKGIDSHRQTAEKPKYSILIDVKKKIILETYIIKYIFKFTIRYRGIDEFFKSWWNFANQFKQLSTDIIK